VRRLAVLTTALALLAAVPASDGAGRAKWDTKVTSQIPRPGFPAHAYAAPNGRVYEGTYDNPSGDTSASRVFELDPGPEQAPMGTLVRSWTITGQDLSQAHGVQVATSDARGRLVLLDKSPPRVLLLDTKTGRQRTYATFPAGAVPNYAAWGPDGSLYVTDYLQPYVWRVPPLGGKPVQWLTDPYLMGGQFGATGIQLLPDRKTLMIGMQSEGGPGVGDPATGRLLKVTIGPDGKPGKLSQFWESQPFDGPDGFAIAKSGNVYVAILVANQIAVIGPDGKEKERFPSTPATGANGSAVPFDNPSSVQFLGDRVFVANQSYFQGSATTQAVLDVEVGEPGLRRLIPRNAGGKPRRRKRH